MNQRARSEAAKLEREEVILDAAETLLRESGYGVLTMQSVAATSGLAKGTIYLYFPSREALIHKVYGRLFDRWVSQFVSDENHLVEFDGFCQEFARYYLSDKLFVELARLPWPFLDPKVDGTTYTESKRAMATRIKRLASLACSCLKIEPTSAHQLVWGLLTASSGALSLTDPSTTLTVILPDDLKAHRKTIDFSSVFFNIVKPLETSLGIKSPDY